MNKAAVLRGINLIKCDQFTIKNSITHSYGITQSTEGYRFKYNPTQLKKTGTLYPCCYSVFNKMRYIFLNILKYYLLNH